MKPSLVHEVSNFAFPVLKAWKATGKQDAASFQSSYLYTQALGASHMAESFWVLFNLDKHDAAKIVARHLLERVYNARFAGKSPEDAVDLICHEIADKIKRQKQFLEANPKLKPSERIPIEGSIASHDVDLQKFLTLLGRPPTENLSIYKRANLVQLKWAHRSIYMDLSNYAHANYEHPHQGEIDIPERIAPAMGLFAPMDCAHQLHKLTCKGGACDMGKKYTSLYDKIMRATVRTTLPQWEALMRF